MKKWILTAFVAAGALFLNSCSTVLNTTTEEVDIKSEPSYAKIIVDGQKFGTTPQRLNLERGKNHIVKLELDGYDTYETQITKKISSTVWFNVFNGIIPGVLIDMFTGSMYNLMPIAMNIELQPAKVIPEKKRR